MTPLPSTCWTLIQDAARGDQVARDLFGARYAPAVRAYLLARWRQSGPDQEVDDAVQEVFIECFKEHGVLARAEPGRGGFRALLFGVVRNIALRFESRPAKGTRVSSLLAASLPDDGPSPSAAFDRAFAESLLAQARGRMEAHAREPDELRQVELLRLRFEDGLSIAHIAERWQEPAAGLHRLYARARKTFQEHLLAVVAEHHPGASPAEVRRACEELFGGLS